MIDDFPVVTPMKYIVGVCAFGYTVLAAACIASGMVGGFYPPSHPRRKRQRPLDAVRSNG
jgi:hypothetical protein